MRIGRTNNSVQSRGEGDREGDRRLPRRDRGSWRRGVEEEEEEEEEEEGG